MARYAATNVTWGRTFLATMLAALGARPGAALLVAPKVRLSKNPSFLPATDALIADYTGGEADFSGYTAGGYAPTFTGTVNLTPFVIGETGNVLPVRDNTSPGVNCSVYGYWIDDGTNVVCSEAFGASGPFQFTSYGDYLDLQVSLPLAMLQSAG